MGGCRLVQLRRSHEAIGPAAASRNRSIIGLSMSVLTADKQGTRREGCKIAEGWRRRGNDDVTFASVCDLTVVVGVG